MKRVCIFCGSSLGALPEYSAAARQCGTVLAGRGLTLVYGGGNIGLMGVLADAALAARGEVIGVIPRQMIDREVAHQGISWLIPVDSMHERKRKMADLAEAFLALPGGVGTMEELFEVFTWLQLGLHHKPVGLLNVSGFYDSLLEFLAHMRGQRFLGSSRSRVGKFWGAEGSFRPFDGRKRGFDRPANRLGLTSVRLLHRFRFPATCR